MTLATIAKKTLPWVRRAAALAHAYELAKHHAELRAQLDQQPVGKDRAKTLRKLADLEVELEKAVGRLG